MPQSQIWFPISFQRVHANLSRRLSYVWVENFRQKVPFRRRRRVVRGEHQLHFKHTVFKRRVFRTSNFCVHVLDVRFCQFYLLVLSKNRSGASCARKVSEKSRVEQNTTSKRGVTRQGHQTQSLSLSLSLFRVNVSPAQKKRRRTVIPSAGFFCKSLICFTIAPTAPLETWSMTMMILMSFLPPSRFSPKPLLQRQKVG